MKLKPLAALPVFFALVFFSFPLWWGFDAVINAIGYFGLFVTFTALIEDDRHFVKPQNFTLLLFVLSLTFIFRLVTQPDLLYVLKLINMLGDLLLIAYTGGAISALCMKNDDATLSKRADSSLHFFIPVIFLRALAPFFPSAEKLMVFGAIALQILILYRFYTLSQELLVRVDEDESEE